MFSSRIRTMVLGAAVLVLVAACSARQEGVVVPETDDPAVTSEPGQRRATGSVLDIFRGGGEQDVKVNRHLWTAALDVLSFLPVEAADPFTGVISTGYGTPPGGGRAYRATVLISDPALDARSLNVALQTRSGPVAAGTQRAVEDAILDRARQLRIEAGRF